jgi:site-specific DNA-adenine methylase
LMFAHRSIIIEKKHWSGAKRAMFTHQETSSNKKATTFVYAHPPRDPVLEEKRFTSTTEGTLEYKGRKVLYSYAEATAISFCSASGANYAGNMIVKGYVVRWKFGTNEEGEALSEIEPITNKKEQEEISQLLWPGMNSSSRVSFG